jgi:hypothetical protein
LELPANGGNDMFGHISLWNWCVPPMSVSHVLIDIIWRLVDRFYSMLPLHLLRCRLRP